MDSFEQVLKDTAEMTTLYKKQVKAERGKEILFPFLILSMILTPVFLVVTDTKPTWMAFLLSASICLGFVVLHICIYLWRRKDQTVRASYKQHVADSLGLDLSQRPPERKDTLKANREG